MENYTNVSSCINDFDCIVYRDTRIPMNFKNKTTFTTTNCSKASNTSVYKRPIIKQKVIFNKNSSCKSIKNKSFGDSGFGDNNFNTKSPHPSVTPKTYHNISQKRGDNLNFFKLLMLSSLIFDDISSNKQLSI